jgi:hypothetical protein
MCAVRPRIAGKPVAFHNPSETAPFGYTGDIDPFTLSENVYCQRVPLDESLFSRRLEFV